MKNAEKSFAWLDVKGIIRLGGRRLKRGVSAVMALAMLMTSMPIGALAEALTEAAVEEQGALTLGAVDALGGERVLRVGERASVRLSTLLAEAELPISIKDVEAVSVQAPAEAEADDAPRVEIEAVEDDYVIHMLRAFAAEELDIVADGETYVLLLKDAAPVDRAIAEQVGLELGDASNDPGQIDAEPGDAAVFTCRLGDRAAWLSALLSEAGMAVAVEDVELVGLPGSEDAEAARIDIDPLDGDYVVCALQAFDQVTLSIHTGSDVYALVLTDGVPPQAEAEAEPADEGAVEPPAEIADAQASINNGNSEQGGADGGPVGEAGEIEQPVAEDGYAEIGAPVADEIAVGEDSENEAAEPDDEGADETPVDEAAGPDGEGADETPVDEAARPDDEGADETPVDEAAGPDGEGADETPVAEEIETKEDKADDTTVDEAPPEAASEANADGTDDGSAEAVEAGSVEAPDAIILEEADAPAVGTDADLIVIGPAGAPAQIEAQPVGGLRKKLKKAKAVPRSTASYDTEHLRLSLDGAPEATAFLRAVWPEADRSRQVLEAYAVADSAACDGIAATLLALPALGSGEYLALYGLRNGELSDAPLVDHLGPGDGHTFSMPLWDGFALVRLGLSEYQQVEHVTDGALIELSGLLPVDADVDVQSVTGYDADAEGETLLAYDIAIADAEDGAFQPDAAESIEITLHSEAIRTALERGSALKAYHFADAAAAPEEVDILSADGDAVTFVAGGFSVYTVVEYVVETLYQDARGDAWKVTAAYTSDTGIPADAELQVRALTGEEYADHIESAAQAMALSPEAVRVLEALDIAFVKDGVEYHDLNGGVRVSIELMDRTVNEDMRVVHMGDAVEVMDADVVDGALSFETSAFSVFIIAEQQLLKRFVFLNGASKTNDVFHEQAIASGERLQMPPMPTQTGKVFRHWAEWAGEPAGEKVEFPVPVTFDADAIPGDDTGAKQDWLDQDENKVYYCAVYGEKNVVVSFYNQSGLVKEKVNVRRPLEDGVYQDFDTAQVDYLPIQDREGAVIEFRYWTEDPQGGTPQVGDTGVPETTRPGVLRITRESPDYIELFPHMVDGHSISFDVNKDYYGLTDADFTRPITVTDDKTAADVCAELNARENHAVPTAPGYTFKGWYIHSVDSRDDAEDGTRSVPVFKAVADALDAEGNPVYTLEANASEYRRLLNSLERLPNNPTLYAHWTPDATADFTVIVWRQMLEKGKYPNGEDKYKAIDGYTFAESFTFNHATGEAHPATLDEILMKEGRSYELSKLKTLNEIADYNAFNSLRDDLEHPGQHPADVAEDVLNPYYGFALNEDMTASGAVVMPDGSTVYNVYYDRGRFTLTFNSESGYAPDDGGEYFLSNNDYLPLNENYYEYDGNYYILNNVTKAIDTVYVVIGNQTYRVSASQIGFGDVDNDGHAMALINGVLYPIYIYQNKKYVYTSWSQFSDQRYSMKPVAVISGRFGESLLEYFPVRIDNDPDKAEYRNDNNQARWDDVTAVREYDNCIAKILSMPGRDLSFAYNDGGTRPNKTLQYLEEVLDGEEHNISDDKKGYYPAGSQNLYREFYKFTAKYNYLTFDEDVYDFEGREYAGSSESWVETAKGDAKSRVALDDPRNPGSIQIFYSRKTYRIYLKDSKGCAASLPGNGTLTCKYAQKITDLNDAAYKLTQKRKVKGPDLAFTGWYLDESCTTRAFFTEEDYAASPLDEAHKDRLLTMPANDIVLYAGWTPIKYRAVIMPNGGSMDGQGLQFHLDRDEKIGLPESPFRDFVRVESGTGAYDYDAKDGTYTLAPEHDGDYDPKPGAYVFKGWYEVEVQDGAIDPAPVEYETGKRTYVLKDPTPVLENGEYKLKTPDKPYTMSEAPNRPIVLTAVWQRAGGFRVRYNAVDPALSEAVYSGVTAPVDDEEYIDRAHAQVRAMAAAPRGYALDFWTDQNWVGDGRDADRAHRYLPNSLIEISAANAALVGSDMVVTLTAHYRPFAPTQREMADYVFMCNTEPCEAEEDGGTAAKFRFKDDYTLYGIQRIAANETLTSPLAPRAPEGYAFKGWYYDKEGTNRFNGFGVIEKPVYTTLYAVYAEAFTVDYYLTEASDDGKLSPTGVVIATQTYRNEAGHYEKLDTRSVIHKVDLDHDVLGWRAFTRSAQGALVFGDTCPYDGMTTIEVRSDLDLCAVIHTRRYVTFDTQCDAFVERQEIPNSGWPVRPTEPVREGYVFEGWYTQPEGGAEYDFDGSVDALKARDVSFDPDHAVLYARWRVNTLKPARTTYTVIWWAQTVTGDCGYEYQKSEQFEGYKGFAVDVTASDWMRAHGGRDLRDVSNLRNYVDDGANRFFEYTASDGLSDAGLPSDGAKTLADDGSTVINLRFHRKRLVIRFDTGEAGNVVNYLGHDYTTGDNCYEIPDAWLGRRISDLWPAVSAAREAIDGETKPFITVKNGYYYLRWSAENATKEWTSLPSIVDAEMMGLAADGTYNGNPAKVLTAKLAVGNSVKGIKLHYYFDGIENASYSQEIFVTEIMTESDSYGTQYAPNFYAKRFEGYDIIDSPEKALTEGPTAGKYNPAAPNNDAYAAYTQETTSVREQRPCYTYALDDTYDYYYWDSDVIGKLGNYRKVNVAFANNGQKDAYTVSYTNGNKRTTLNGGSIAYANQGTSVPTGKVPNTLPSWPFEQFKENAIRETVTMEAYDVPSGVTTYHYHFYYKAHVYKVKLMVKDGDQTPYRTLDVPYGRVVSTCVDDKTAVPDPDSGKRHIIFDCWSVTKFSPEPYADTMPAHDLVLYAAWKDKTFTVTTVGIDAEGNRFKADDRGREIDADGNPVEDGRTSATYAIAYDRELRTLNIPHPTAENKLFTGWRDVDGGKAVAGVCRVTKDLYIRPDWDDLDIWKVRYDANVPAGLTGAGVAPKDDNSYIADSVVTILDGVGVDAQGKPAPLTVTRRGVDGKAYEATFACWVDGAGNRYYADATYTIAADSPNPVVFRAVYGEYRETILTYNKNADDAVFLLQEADPQTGERPPYTHKLITDESDPNYGSVRVLFRDPMSGEREGGFKHRPNGVFLIGEDEDVNTDAHKGLHPNPSKFTVARVDVAHGNTYVFGGWAEAPDASLAIAQNGERARVNTIMQEEKNTLYALWAICKVADRDGKTHVFSTLSDAADFIAADPSIDNKTGTIEMLADYNVPADDVVTIPADAHVTLTTASATGDGPYAYRDTLFGKDAADRGTAVIRRFEDGGSLFTGAGELTLRDVVVDGGSAQGRKSTADGGLVNVAGGSVVLGDGATLRDSDNTGNGGAIHAAAGASVSVGSGAAIENCKTLGDGGAIHAGAQAKVTMTGGSITGCAANKGAAVYLENGIGEYARTSFAMSGGSITGNAVDADTGAVEVGGANTALSFSGDPAVHNNSYTDEGGGSVQKNVTLGTDGNGVVRARAGLMADAHIGVYVTDAAATTVGGQCSTAYAEHGKPGTPFGAHDGGMTDAILAAFTNDRIPNLTGALSRDPAQAGEIVWGKTFDLIVRKIWLDADLNEIDAPRGAGVTIEVRADNAVYQAVSFSGSTWSQRLNYLPALNESGETCAYTLAETLNSAENYARITFPGDKGTATPVSYVDDRVNAQVATVYNHCQKTDFTVTKSWVDAPDGARLRATVKLYKVPRAATGGQAALPDALRRADTPEPWNQYPFIDNRTYTARPTDRFFQVEGSQSWYCCTLEKSNNGVEMNDRIESSGQMGENQLLRFHRFYDVVRDGIGIENNLYHLDGVTFEPGDVFLVDGQYYLLRTTGGALAIMTDNRWYRLTPAGAGVSGDTLAIRYTTQAQAEAQEETLNQKLTALGETERVSAVTGVSGVDGNGEFVLEKGVNDAARTFVDLDSNYYYYAVEQKVEQNVNGIWVPRSIRSNCIPTYNYHQFRRVAARAGGDVTITNTCKSGFTVEKVWTADGTNPLNPEVLTAKSAEVKVYAVTAQPDGFALTDENYATLAAGGTVAGVALSADPVATYTLENGVWSQTCFEADADKLYLAVETKVDGRYSAEAAPVYHFDADSMKATITNRLIPPVRVSLDGGATWKYFNKLITDGDAVGAFDYANTAEGGATNARGEQIIIETLKAKDPSYTLDAPFTFDNQNFESLTIRTTREDAINPVATDPDTGVASRFTSLLENDQTAGPMLTFTDDVTAAKLQRLELHGHDTRATGNGGAVSSGTAMTLDDVYIHDFKAEKGSAVYVTGGSLTVKDSTVFDNVSGSDSGAIDMPETGAEDVTLAFTGSTFVRGNHGTDASTRNVVLRYDSNSIINADGLSDNARIGVRVTPAQFADHGEQDRPFGVHTGDADTAHPESFVNDENGYIGTAGDNGLIKWDYVEVPMIPINLEKVWGDGTPDAKKPAFISFHIQAVRHDDTANTDRVFDVKAYDARDARDQPGHEVTTLTAENDWKAKVFVPEYDAATNTLFKDSENYYYKIVETRLADDVGGMWLSPIVTDTEQDVTPADPGQPEGTVIISDADAARLDKHKYRLQFFIGYDKTYTLADDGNGNGLLWIRYTMNIKPVKYGYSLIRLNKKTLTSLSKNGWVYIYNVRMPRGVLSLQPYALSYDGGKTYIQYADCHMDEISATRDNHQDFLHNKRDGIYDGQGCSWAYEEADPRPEETIRKYTITNTYRPIRRTPLYVRKVWAGDMAALGAKPSVPFTVKGVYGGKEYDLVAYESETSMTPVTVLDRDYDDADDDANTWQRKVWVRDDILTDGGQRVSLSENGSFTIDEIQPADTAVGAWDAPQKDVSGSVTETTTVEVPTIIQTGSLSGDKHYYLRAGNTSGARATGIKSVEFTFTYKDSSDGNKLRTARIEAYLKTAMALDEIRALGQSKCDKFELNGFYLPDCLTNRTVLSVVMKDRDGKTLLSTENGTATFDGFYKRQKPAHDDGVLADDTGSAYFQYNAWNGEGVGRPVIEIYGNGASTAQTESVSVPLMQITNTFRPNYLCKVTDANGVEHGFMSLRDAMRYARENMRDAQNKVAAAIEMLRDYDIPRADQLDGTCAVGANEDITITTARTGEYRYADNSKDAAIRRAESGADADGALIVVDAGGKLTLDGVRLDGNKAGGMTGRAVRVDSTDNGDAYTRGELTITGGTKIENFKTTQKDARNAAKGGAIFLDAGTKLTVAGVAGKPVEFNSNEIVNTTAPGGTNETGADGGAISSLRDVEITIDHASFKGNGATSTQDTAKGNGGAIALTDTTTSARGQATLIISNTAFGGDADAERNLASNDGGAIRVSGNTAVTLTDCAFNNNCAQHGQGGAVAVLSDSSNASRLTIHGGSFTSNSAAAAGGAVKVGRGAALAIDREGVSAGAVFGGGDRKGNESRGNGGAIECAGNNAVHITDATISCNSTTNGNGAGVYLGGGTATLDGATALQNNAANHTEDGKGKGGALYVKEGEVNLSGTIRITGNTASGDNGGAVNVGSKVDASGSVTSHGTVNLGGNVVVKDNGPADDSGKVTQQKNIVLDVDSAKAICTAGDGLGEHASVGVYVADVEDKYTGKKVNEERGISNKPFATFGPDDKREHPDGFKNDRNDKLFGTGKTDADVNVYWSPLVAKLTDEEGNLLYTAKPDGSGPDDSSPAVYTSVKDAFDAADPTDGEARPKLYQKVKDGDGDKWERYEPTEPVQVRMLSDYEPERAEAIDYKYDRDVTLTTAPMDSSAFTDPNDIYTFEPRPLLDADGNPVMENGQAVKDPDTRARLTGAHITANTTKTFTASELILDGASKADGRAITLVKNENDTSGTGKAFIEDVDIKHYTTSKAQNTDAKASGTAGAIYTEVPTTLTGVSIESATADGGNGGAIYAGDNLTVQPLTDESDPTKLVKPTEIKNCQAKQAPADPDNTGKGGGVYAAEGATTLKGATISGNSAVNGGGVYVAEGAALNMNDPAHNSAVKGNAASGNGAGIYLEEGSALNLAGKPDFGPGEYTDGAETHLDRTGENKPLPTAAPDAGNYSETDLGDNPTNGRGPYEKARQDIFINGCAGTPATSIVVTGDLTSAPGSLWVWPEATEDHGRTLTQFAMLDKNADGNYITVTEATYTVFRNALTDRESGCGGEYLTGRPGDAPGEINWTGGGAVSRKVILRKVDASGYMPLADAHFRIYRADMTEVQDARAGYSETNGCYQSGSSGVYFIGDLPLGKYYLLETATASGYEDNRAKAFVLTIGEDGPACRELSLEPDKKGVTWLDWSLNMDTDVEQTVADRFVSFMKDRSIALKTHENGQRVDKFN